MFSADNVKRRLTLEGKYSLKWLIVLERQSDGAWKWTHEIWNENEPFPEKPAKEQ